MYLCVLSITTRYTTCTSYIDQIVMSVVPVRIIVLMPTVRILLAHLIVHAGMDMKNRLLPEPVKVGIII